MFSKKHYIKIASILAETKPTIKPEEKDDLLDYSSRLLVWKDIVGAFVAMFAEDSKPFNIDKFWKAVNGKEMSK